MGIVLLATAQSFGIAFALEELVTGLIEAGTLVRLTRTGALPFPVTTPITHAATSRRRHSPCW